jgi:plasmid stabilization system protein ParE
MKRFVITPDAFDDLEHIFQYIARSSPSAAKKVVREIRAGIHKVAVNPGLGHLRADLVDEPLRFWGVYSYLIIYRAERKPIEVLRILHGAQDVKSILRRL